MRPPNKLTWFYKLNFPANHRFFLNELALEGPVLSWFNFKNLQLFWQMLHITITSCTHYKVMQLFWHNVAKNLQLYHPTWGWHNEDKCYMHSRHHFSFFFCNTCQNSLQASAMDSKICRVYFLATHDNVGLGFQSIFLVSSFIGKLVLQRTLRQWKVEDDLAIVGATMLASKKKKIDGGAPIYIGTLIPLNTYI